MEDKFGQSCPDVALVLMMCLLRL